jgi:hypothetical protein
MNHENIIPPITDPLGRGWRQPDSRQVLIDDNCAMMTEQLFKNLAEYSTSTPSGVYPGKMWKSRRGNIWYLRWFAADDGDPRGLPTPTREIVIV